MMKKLIKNITSIFLVLVFFISSTGFNIYKHHCNSCNLSQVSIILENFNCHHKQEDFHIDSENPSSCCISFKKNDSKRKHNCCDTKKVFLKINSAYEKPEFENSILKFNEIYYSYGNILDVDDVIVKIKPNAKPDLKIHLFSGKKLVFFLHQQKIAPPLV